ncbi:MAG: GMC family oxidoreductase N-terminal domain-containing protein [Chloroflexi bacterium]|nr:GMC family oxidoreductase N-terminal domain-containing protein [Chloroflexota bacterium]
MRYDTIIIGAGSAGGILASRLTENRDHSVLLLEAGPDYPTLDRTPEPIRNGLASAGDVIIREGHNWNFTATASPTAPPMYVPRGRVVGGSSAINGQIFLRGAQEDYDSWADAGNDLWSFRNLLPSFRRLETDSDFHDDFHGDAGPIYCRRFPREEWLPAADAFYSSARDAGYPDCPDHNNPDMTGVGPVPLNNLNGVRMSTAVTYLTESRPRLNLTIRGGCLVQRVLFDRSGKLPRATGVLVESDGETFEVAAGEVILSGGPVGSPHLLMLSGVGPASQLAGQGIPLIHDSPGVGQNLRDHPTVWVEHRLADDYPKRAFGIPDQVCLRWTAQGSDLVNDMILFATPYDIGISEGGSREPTGEMGLRWRCRVNLAYGAGELRLASSDPRTQPDLDYNLLSDERDVARLREAVRLALRLAEHPSFKGIIGDRIEPAEQDLESDDALDAWMMRRVQTGHHISGTCKMGPDEDPMAVVDQYGRVRGVEGLRVADASIMPDCVRANTNQTALMIGERVAELIAGG